jgi:hypothetical protein
MNMMRLIEESAGVGSLTRNTSTPVSITSIASIDVRYRISRYQGFMEDSGLPIPGLYRIEGTVDLDSDADSSSWASWIDAPVTLRLEDGRSLQITVVDKTGRVLSEGHGPMKCMCC